MNRRCTALLLFAFLAAPSFDRALARTPPKSRSVARPVGKDAEAVHAINGNVYEVLTGGWWCNAGQEGPYRFVVLSNSHQQTEHNLYLQLLAASAGKTDAQVVKTVPIVETHNAALFFEDLKLRETGRCTTIVLEGKLQRRMGNEDRFEELQLKAFQNGDYLATFEAEVIVTPTPLPAAPQARRHAH